MRYLTDNHMKSVRNLFVLLILSIFCTSAVHPSEKGITSIRWTSTSYTDLKTGGQVNMANEFICSPKGIYWSLFEQDLPVTDVIWKIDQSMTGLIAYTISDETMKGRISFDLTRKNAEVELKTEVGFLHFSLVMESIQNQSK